MEDERSGGRGNRSGSNVRENNKKKVKGTVIPFSVSKHRTYNLNTTITIAHLLIL